MFSYSLNILSFPLTFGVCFLWNNHRSPWGSGQSEHYHQGPCEVELKDELRALKAHEKAVCGGLETMTSYKPLRQRWHHGLNTHKTDITVGLKSQSKDWFLAFGITLSRKKKMCRVFYVSINSGLQQLMINYLEKLTFRTFFWTCNLPWGFVLS